MNKEEATKFLALIKIAYPKSYRNMDKDSLLATVNMWHTTFADVPYAIMEMALEHFRKESEFEPTVASIYKELKGLYYTALGDVLTTEDKTIRNLGEYIMQHTKRFTQSSSDNYSINYKSFAKLVNKNDNNLLLEGGNTDGS